MRLLIQPETSTVSRPMPSTDSTKRSSFSARLRSVSLYSAISSLPYAGASADGACGRTRTTHHGRGAVIVPMA